MHKLTLSLARVDLVHNVALSLPSFVRGTGVFNALWNLQFLDVVGPFKNVDVKACTHMPSNVAVEWPDTWVVLIELNHNVGWHGGGLGSVHQENVATLRVECILDFAIPEPVALIKDPEIVTVQVHRVGSPECVVNN